MKKRTAIMILCLSLGAVLLGGCGKENKDPETSKSVSVSSESSVSASSPAGENEEIPIVGDEVALEDCITLGDYKGLTLDKKIQAVTDQDIEDSLSEALMQTVEDPDATVQEGDLVDIAYEGKKDGVAFEGGTSDSTNLKIGSHTFIDGFEDGIIGMKADETKDLNLTFPEVYQNNPDLAGADVVFTVTVNAISRPGELTDDWVKENSEYSTVEEYRQSRRQEMEAANEASAESDLESLALETVVKNAEVTQIPQSYYDLGVELYENQYKMYAQMYGMELDEFVESYMDKNEYESSKQTYARGMAKTSLVIRMVQEKEGWTTEDVDYMDRLNNYVENSGQTEEEFLESNGKENVELTIMMERLIDLVIENGTVNEVHVDSDGNKVE